MFGPVSPTPYDLQFSLFGIPVRVLPWFWLMAVVLGWPRMEAGAPSLLLWVFAVFLSILVHEFGHALTARACGYPPQVLLYQFGGLALFAPHRNYTLVRSILITAAGPAAGLLLGGLADLALRGVLRDLLNGNPVTFHRGLIQFLLDMWYIGIYWSLLNLLPVLPLDGGQITRDLLLLVTPRHGLRIALTLSAVVGALVAVYGIQSERIYLAIMFGSMAAGSIQALQQRRW
jgi:membrane-associated protease RseP (regulator of RpoE activity)